MIEVDPKGLEYKENDMSYLDFLIRKEYAFLRNIFDEDELKQSKSICNLESYWNKMKLYLHLIKVSEIELKSANFLVISLTNYYWIFLSNIVMHTNMR